jgi:hypothetical protein
MGRLDCSLEPALLSLPDGLVADSQQPADSLPTPGRREWVAVRGETRQWTRENPCVPLGSTYAPLVSRFVVSKSRGVRPTKLVSGCAGRNNIQRRMVFACAARSRITN